MKKEYTIKAPYEFFVGNKKRFANLNKHLNLHYREQAKAKNEYEYICKDLLKDCPVFEGEVEIEFKYISNYRKSPKTVDKSNVYSMIVKFLYDAMSKNNKWEDDNDNLVKREIIYPSEYIEKKKGELEKYALVTIRQI